MLDAKIPLSVFIISYNEEDRIANSIKSVIDWVDEVIIIDSGSQDNTVAISQKLGATVIYNEWQGYGPQKVFGEAQCKNDWILNIDADEVVSAELALEIIELFKNNDINHFHAYQIYWKIFWWHENLDDYINNKTKIISKIKNKLRSGAWFIRIYNKQHTGFKNSVVHDSVKINDNAKIGKLSNNIYHFSFRSYEHWLDKINYITTLQANDNLTKGRNFSVFRLITEPVFSFFKAYFIRRYFIFGANGFVYSVYHSFFRFSRIAKTRDAFSKLNINGQQHS